MARMIATHEPTLTPITEEPITINDRFRANVRRLMRAHNISQQTLAERLNALGKPCTRISLNQMMNHPGSPRMEWIELAARALECSEHELLVSE